VVVDDLELLYALETGEGVVQLVQRRPDELGRSLLEDRDEVRLRRRVAGGEKRYFVASLGETVGEERDDPLDAPVARGRDGEPDRAENGDLQAYASSTLTAASSRWTFQVLSNARTPASLSDPAQEGNSGGATVSSTCRPWSG
jgi:hypothetical protein